MSLLDGLVGGAAGAGMVTVVNRLIEQHGGVQGIVSQFEQQGFGPTIRSWVETGPNQPIAPDDLRKALGSDTIKQFAAKLGVPAEEVSAKLAEFLPRAIDKLTPEGRVQ